MTTTLTSEIDTRLDTLCDEFKTAVHANQVWPTPATATADLTALTKAATAAGAAAPAIKTFADALADKLKEAADASVIPPKPDKSISNYTGLSDYISKEMPATGKCWFEWALHRLFYTGTTRAKCELHIVDPKNFDRAYLI